MVVSERQHKQTSHSNFRVVIPLGRGRKEIHKGHRYVCNILLSQKKKNPEANIEIKVNLCSIRAVGTWIFVMLVTVLLGVFKIF